MEKKRKPLKIILWIFIILLLAGGGYLLYLYFSESGNRNALSVIPKDAIYIIETENATDAWETLQESKMWRHMLNSPKFEDINASAMSLDSLIEGNTTLKMLLKNRQVVISSHMVSLNDYDFIFAVNLKKASKISFLKNYIKEIVGYFDFAYNKRTYNGNEIIELTDVASGDILSLCFVENIMVCSYSPVLIEKAIDQQNSGFWTNNPQVRFVSTEIKGNKLFKLYLNYSMMDEFMKCYLSEPSSFISSLDKSLNFSAFDVVMSDELLTWKGYTSVNDSFPSYYKAIAGIEPGPFKAYEIIPDKAALYVSVSFNKSKDFFDKLKEVYRAEDTTKADNYEKTIKKVEKVVKVNLEEDFFGWIGNEISFVKLQPSANAREYDAICMIQANDIAKAKSSLEKIARNVKRRTLGLLKFDDAEYKSYTIKNLEYGWFLKLLFGKTLSKFDRPYYIIIDDYVVFSNSPSCLMDFIDDYTVGNTLSHNEEFMHFMNNFENQSNISIFVQMPKIYSHMYYYSKDEKRKGIQDNKETILSFTRVGLQLTSDEKMFKTTLVADFDESAAFSKSLEDVESAAEDLYLTSIDSGNYKVVVPPSSAAKSGPLKIYYADSTTLKAEGRLVDGKPDGLWRSYFKSGKIMAAVNYAGGKANGIAMFYFDGDKQIIRVELTFADDKINGVYREFYMNGNRKAMLNFTDGLPDGDAEFYYDSGVLKIEGQYEEGVKEGKWKHYTETGELIDKEKWKKNKGE